jgi:hypothetical protein
MVVIRSIKRKKSKQCFTGAAYPQCLCSPMEIMLESYSSKS